MTSKKTLPLVELQDEVHDFLFLDTIKKGIDYGVMLDFHIRPAGTAEMEAAWEKYLTGALKDWVPPATKVPNTQFGTRWLHTSNMQKSIRRSDFWHAWQSAEYLIAEGFEDKLWTRIAVTAAEDVGFGHPYMVAMALWVARSKTVRKKLGPKILPYILWELCRQDIPKSRDWTDIFAFCLWNNGLVEKTYDENYGKPLEKVIEGVLDDTAGIECRIAALWEFYPRYLLIEGRKFEPRFTKEDRQVLIDTAGWPGLLSYIWHWTQTATGYGLGVLTPLVWERMCLAKSAVAGIDPYALDKWKNGPQFEKLPKSDGMWSAAIDMHTQEGKRAINYFLKASKVFASHELQSVAKHRWKDAIQEALFYAEVAVLVPRLQYDGFDFWFAYYRDAYFRNYGFTDEQSKKLIIQVRDELPVLNNARLVIMGMK